MENCSATSLAILAAALAGYQRARDRAEKNLHRVILVGANASARRLFEITRTEFLLDDPETADVLSRFVGSESRGTGQALAAVLNIDARVA